LKPPTSGTIAKPQHISVFLYESMRQWWLANPTMKLDKSTKFGWFVKGKKKRDMGEHLGTSPFVAFF